MIRTGLLAACILAVAALPGFGDIVVPMERSGVFNAAGGFSNALGGGNYRVGLAPITTTPEHRNFFIFDLSGYAPAPPGTIIGAVLKLYLPKFAPPDLLDPGFGYISPDPTELYRVTATPFSPETLSLAGLTTPEATAIFGTLGTGPLAGEFLFDPSHMGDTASIFLTPDAVTAIIGAMGVGKIALGGRIASFDGTHVDELLFAFTDIPSPHMAGKAPSLVLLTAVPEAGGWLQVGAAAAVAGAIKRFRRI